MYLITTPWWLRAFYPDNILWEMGARKRTLYLTFDDGPHETATPFVLETLQSYNAKASFFCIGKNVTELNKLYEQIIQEGHSVGNHTQNHLNGWKTDDKSYLSNIEIANTLINSHLFRPPYGRIKLSQIRGLNSISKEATMKENSRGDAKLIVMWSVLSGDFDNTISPQKCLKNVLTHSKAGSIIVFHDSQKAWNNLNFALPKVLAHFSNLGYTFEALPMNKK